MVKDEKVLEDMAEVMDYYQLLDDPDQTISMISTKTHSAFKGTSDL